jgi:hypothetical protein
LIGGEGLLEESWECVVDVWVAISSPNLAGRLWEEWEDLGKTIKLPHKFCRDMNTDQTIILWFGINSITDKPKFLKSNLE